MKMEHALSWPMTGDSQNPGSVTVSMLLTFTNVLNPGDEIWKVSSPEVSSRLSFSINA